MYTSASRHAAGINHTNQGSAFYKPVAVNVASTTGGADMMQYDKQRNSKVSLTKYRIKFSFDFMFCGLLTSESTVKKNWNKTTQS